MLGDSWDLQLQRGCVSFKEVDLLLDANHLRTEVNKLFFLVKLASVM